MKITVPEPSLVVLAGPSGSGKSTFARRHFRPTEVISSDYCRGLVSDDENDLSATGDAFDVLHYIASKRLAGRRLTVVDATSVKPDDRAGLVALAREHHLLAAAIVLDLPPRLCQERNESRADRDIPSPGRAPPESGPAPLPARPPAGGLPLGHRPRQPGRSGRGRHRTPAPVAGPARRERPLRHHRRRPRLS